MTKTVLLFVATFIAPLLAVPSFAAANPKDVTVPIHQFIDGFNTGDTKSAYAAMQAAMSSSSTNLLLIFGSALTPRRIGTRTMRNMHKRQA